MGKRKGPPPGRAPPGPPRKPHLSIVPPDLRTAGQNPGKVKKRPRGRPFKAGEPPPVGRPFPKGNRLNPGGRPKSELGFRERCREIAGELLELVNDRLQQPDEYTTMDGVLAGLSAPEVAMIQAIWDRAGYIVPKKIELGGPGGGPIQVDATRGLTTDEMRQRLRELQEQARQQKALAPIDVTEVEDDGGGAA